MFFYQYFYADQLCLSWIFVSRNDPHDTDTTFYFVFQAELQNLQEIEKKYKELKKKYKALEAKKVVAKPVPAASKSADPAEIKKLEKKV